MSLLLVVPVAGAAAGPVSPTVTAVAGAPSIAGHTSFDLSTVGYEQSEHFLQGSATAYAPTAPLLADGRWEVAPSTSAPYLTRVVVNRPIDPRDFNGTVVVEWLNVSGGLDASPEWMQAHVELIRGGYAWVGVTAQAVGLNALRASSAELPGGSGPRYASLSHPGDSYSYDMFSQAGQAVRDHARTMLGGLSPERVLAAGESQSAGRLVTYIDAVDPLAGVYDGFLVHSRGAGAAALTQDPLPVVAPPSPTFVRDDLDVPVLVFQTESDTSGLQARRTDTARFRLWEVAGTAHYDQYGLALGATDDGGRAHAVEAFEAMRTPSAGFGCALPINAGPATYVVRAAVAALHTWVAEGAPPPRAPRLELSTSDPVQYATDAQGNARGGIRTPAVDAPVAVLGGLGNSGTGPVGQFCRLFGTTVPLTPEQLVTHYGDQHGFAAAWRRATRAARRAGFLRPADARMLGAIPGETIVIP